jgi:hypothetical protein
MPGFRGPNPYAGTAGADLENAPTGPVPFTSPFGLPITRMRVWYAGGSLPGTGTGVPGTPVQRASGNPGIATAAGSVVQSPYGGQQITHAGNYGGVPPGPAGYNGVIGGSNGGNPNSPEVSGLPQFGSRGLNVMQESAFRGPGGGVGNANDRLITYDRHVFAKIGYENSGRSSGMTDPPQDGPARPSYQMLNRSVNYQQGTDNDAAQDDLSRDYTRNSGGMYVAEQGSGWAPVYGGVPGLYQPYGSYAGVTPGPVKGIQSPVAQGAQGDGPRKVWSGPPHGLHSPSLPAYSNTIGRYLAIPQMHAPRQDRPSNSPVAGQSYSQTVQMQGQAGTVPQNVNVNSGVSFNQRMRGNGWRGKA